MADKKKASTKKPQNKAESKSSDALESFLSRENKQKKSDNKKDSKKKSNKKVVIAIVAAAAVAILVVILIILNSRPAPTMDENPHKDAVLIREVNEKGEHTVNVPTDENGEISGNGAGSLLGYVPADISRVDVENPSGSFSVLSKTEEGQATVYTLVGFEGSELQTGVPDEIATDASAGEITQIIAVNANLEDFGLDKPRAKVKVTYTDNTTAYLKIGNEAAGGVGTYISLGDSNDVFLADNAAVDSFFYDVTEFLSLTVNDSASDSDNAEFSTLTVSGTRYKEPITITPNTDEALDAVYMMTKPILTPANATEAYDIAGNVRGLYAESVVAVNPSEDRLKELGLAEPYASVKAEYPDCTVVLHASKADDNGIVNLYNPDKNTVYTIQLAAVCWAKTSVEALMPETVLSVKLAAVNKIDFSAGDKNYSFSADVTTTTVTDENDVTQEVTTVKATYNGKELKEDNYRVFFQNLNEIKNQGAASADAGSSVMKFSVGYSTGRDADTVEAYTYSADKAMYLIKLNGKTVGTASKKYIESLIESAETLASGKEVPNI